MNETTERFLQEIATRVGYDRVAELYLFPVLRQGGVEGAVAVVAAYPEVPEVAAASGSSEAAEPMEVGDDTEATAEGSPEAAAPTEGGEETEGEPTASSGEAAADDESVTEAEAAADATVAATDAPADAGVESSAETSADVSVESANATRVRARHVVYTARYRHTIKGTDRGRWVVEVVAEADAPLITVEEVVRGVVRRSGDEFQPERISGEQFRALVRAPAAPGSAPA